MSLVAPGKIQRSEHPSSGFGVIVQTLVKDGFAGEYSVGICLLVGHHHKHGRRKTESWNMGTTRALTMPVATQIRAVGRSSVFG